MLHAGGETCICHHREDINLTLGFTVPSNAIWFIVMHSNPAPIPAIGKHNYYKVQSRIKHKSVPIPQP